jgi:hypothetical protein
VGSGMRSLTAGYHSLTQSLTRSLPHSLQDQGRKRLLPPRAISVQVLHFPGITRDNNEQYPYGSITSCDCIGG